MLWSPLGGRGGGLKKRECLEKLGLVKSIQHNYTASESLFEESINLSEAAAHSGGLLQSQTLLHSRFATCLQEKKNSEGIYSDKIIAHLLTNYNFAVLSTLLTL